MIASDSAPERTGLARLASDVREIVQEQRESHELLLQMTRRDLLLRYKQTAMGFGWAVSMPILNMVIFSVIFTRVVRLDTDLPYPVFAYAGLLPWNFFASSLRFAAESLTKNTPLVTKVYFPREVRNLFYRDVRYLFEIVLTVWMFATSVVYPVERIGGLLGDVLLLNPMTSIIDAYRAVLLRGALPAAGPFAGAALLSCLTLGVAWIAFHRAKFAFAENI
jgi:ABC-type polysaccharide/polyol phosphate export permease